jgi:hypothetical protein
MTRNQRNGLLGLLLVIAVALAGVLVWLLRTPAVAPGTEDASALEAPVRAPEPAADEPVELSRVELTRPDDAPDPSTLETTVIHPLKIELDLVRSKFELQAEEAPALGSAATAAIKGSVFTTGETGVRVEVRFVAGPNEGRVLYSDRNGAFGASDLYPGLSLVRVTGAEIPGSLREVRLRQERESQLNLGYSRLSVVHGLVQDREAKPIAGALVSMDGQETTSGEDGRFVYTGMAAGELIVTVAKPGFSAVRQQITVVGGTTIDPGKLIFTLDRGGRLEITIADRINADRESQVFVLPENLDGERKFPWHTINPVRIFPGGTVTIEDLPAMHVVVRAFHSGAVAKPRSKRVLIVAGETAHETLNLEKSPVVIGVISLDGKPAADATVRLEVPDRVAAMNAAIGGTDFLSLEREVLPNLPPAVQETRTNALGEFVLSANEDVSKQRYLVALSADGRSRGGRVLRGGEQRADVELVPLAEGEGEIVLQTNARFQPLPVEITVNGAPRDRFFLQPGQDLHVDGLTSGSWKMSARWSSDELQKDLPVELDGSATLSLTLPEGAILGQDEETRKRAGKK